MPVSSPLPSNLPKECAKAAQIFASFSSIIPNEILRGARGFAILTIAKAGFLFSARAGSGLVVVKLANGSWSGPSAIGTGGLGVGGQAGAELSEFVIILNSKAAVQSFMTAGSINLGGNLSVAVGPIGRNAEASGSLNKRATMYSYSRTRGLFGGASLEGSVILERSDANVKAYAASGEYTPEEITARNILSGQIEAPGWANILIQSIERRVGTLFNDTWIDDAPSDTDEQGRPRGYSFGSEFASLGSSTNGREKRAAGSPKDRLDRLQNSERDWDDDAEGQRGTDSKGPGGRLRGYSLGSFRKAKSGSSTPTRRAATGRDRAYSAADPTYRYRDPDEEDDGYGRREDDDDEDFSRPQRSASRMSDDVPASPSSTTSSLSRAQRLTDFMKRPVLPARKSTSAIDRFNDGRTSPTIQRSSPLTGGGGGRTRSGTLASSIGRGAKGRLEHSGRYSSDEETGVRRGRDEDEPDSPFGASPFADRFGQVEHRFSDNEDELDTSVSRRRAGSGSREVATRPSRSGSSSMAASVLGSITRPKLGSRKSSNTGGAAGAAAGAAATAANAVKGVFKARPGLSKRSATAPTFSRDAGDGDDRWNADAYRRRQRGGFDDEDDDGPGYGRLEGNRDNELDDILVDTRQHSNGHSDNSSDEDGGHQIQIRRPDNPFAETAASKEGRYDVEDSSLFGSKKGNRDMIASLDEADEADLHLTGSSFESHSLARPTHRLESRNTSSTGARRALAPLEDDGSSIRSLDSRKGETTFGGRGMKAPVELQQTEADFFSQLESGPYVSQTDTRATSRPIESKKEWRIATFDFEGGEEADLPFKVGEILEVLNKDDPEWFLARLGMREGIIPVNRTKPYSQ